MCFSSSYSATGCPVIGLEPFFRVCVGMGREWETKLKLALAMAHMNDAQAIVQQAWRKEQGCASVLELLRDQEDQARLQVHLCRRDTNAEAASAVAPAVSPTKAPADALAVARTNLARARDKHRVAGDDHLDAKEWRISAECYEQRATGKLRKAQQWVERCEQSNVLQRNLLPFVFICGLQLQNWYTTLFCNAAYRKNYESSLRLLWGLV